MSSKAHYALGVSKPVILRTEEVSKSYPMGENHIEILHSINLEVEESEALCIMGASGAGKSTLLHIMGTLDRPTEGRVLFRDKDLFAESEDKIARFRNEKMGFVFQFHHLLNEFSALENVMMPCRIAGLPLKEARERAEALLEEFGLSHRLTHHPTELSGGEQQRVAIARALIRNPEVLFADEPTGSLDSATGGHIQDLFFELKEKRGLTLIMVTHDKEFSRRFQRVMLMKDGRWVERPTGAFSDPGNALAPK